MPAAKSAMGLGEMRAWALVWVVVMMVQLHGSGAASRPPPLKGTVRTIQSIDGDIVECVLKHQQPALKHPLLKNHTIQEFPSFLPVDDHIIKETQSKQSTSQVWHEKERCPFGTIPIIRKDPTQVVHKKQFYPTASISQSLPKVGPGHEYGVAFYTPPTNNSIYGASLILNLWDPNVEANVDEFSLSQLWITAGSYENNDLNTIEVGWQVFPQQYNTTRPCLFIYWTADAYDKTGCYNVDDCAGFVQVDNTIALGGALQVASSVYEGDQVELPRILVWQDQQTQNWWLQYGSVNIGYWPKELFTNLENPANTLSWGGEVINLLTGGSHTTTQMGSGHFASEGFQGACYSRSLTFVDSTNTLYDVPLENVTLVATNTSCYDIDRNSSTNWGTYIFFGGPGRNPKCP